MSAAHVTVDHRTAEQISFQARFDAAQKTSWQGRCDTELRLEKAHQEAAAAGGPVDHHELAEVANVDDQCVIVVDNLKPGVDTVTHLVECLRCTHSQRGAGPHRA